MSAIGELPLPANEFVFAPTTATEILNDAKINNSATHLHSCPGNEIPIALAVTAEMMHVYYYLVGVTMRALTTDGFIYNDAHRRIHDMLLDRLTNVPQAPAALMGAELIGVPLSLNSKGLAQVQRTLLVEPPAGVRLAQVDPDFTRTDASGSSGLGPKVFALSSIHPKAMTNDSTLFAQIFWTIRKHNPSQVTEAYALEVLRALRFCGMNLNKEYSFSDASIMMGLTKSQAQLNADEPRHALITTPLHLCLQAGHFGEHNLASDWRSLLAIMMFRHADELGIDPDQISTACWVYDSAETARMTPLGAGLFGPSNITHWLELFRLSNAESRVSQVPCWHLAEGRASDCNCGAQTYTILSHAMNRFTSFVQISCLEAIQPHDDPRPTEIQLSTPKTDVLEAMHQLWNSCAAYDTSRINNIHGALPPQFPHVLLTLITNYAIFPLPTFVPLAVNP